jgi:ABC-type phosphate transport system substrate-binding protein
MKVPAITIGLVGSCLLPALLQAQVSLTVSGREVQIHGYLSEGFVSSGKGAMPKMFASDAEVVAYVRNTKGAIGYVSAGAITEGVKVLDVK